MTVHVQEDRDIDRTGFVLEWERWHGRKEEVLAGPHGFLVDHRPAPAEPSATVYVAAGNALIEASP
ncbi:hypothetical protein [Streptomyces sp. ID05-47C]|uniref:hypothetical protein n=1 Tax=Streptomyces sp. ID05-47C TaxID=3028665 RepID=UPI0029B9E357|nr:hypothetical protein [Streptomyces sp. ID05-47C]MDX3568509.1 hypothetical protein [Streptomyces sp. ID05-47C]